MDDRLKDFPHSFQLVELKEVTKERRKSILDRMILQQTEAMSVIEKNRIDNFVSYLFFMQEEDASALETNAKVIQRDQTNIVALANRIRYIYKTDVDKAEVYMKELEEIKKNNPDYQRMHAVAEAEVAFCLASISPLCYAKAAKLYRIVNDKYPTEYLWKFGEALVLRRCVSFNNYSIDPTHDVVLCSVRCKELLQEIAESADKPLKAKAWIQLGELVKLINLKQIPFDDGSIERINRETDLPPRGDCYKQALDACPDDAFVLLKCGVYYHDEGCFGSGRKDEDLNQAEKLLKKAIELSPTTASHQVLADTLKEKARTLERGYQPRGRRIFKLSRDNPYIPSIMDNLNKAIEMSEDCNLFAVEVLGFTYLEIDDKEKAEECFRKIIQSENLPTPIKKVNACEQVALLCLEKSKKAGITEEQRDEFIDECLFLLTEAVKAVTGTDRGFEVKGVFRKITDDLRQSGNTVTRKKVADLFELIANRNQ